MRFSSASASKSEDEGNAADWDRSLTLRRLWIACGGRFMGVREFVRELADSGHPE